MQSKEELKAKSVHKIIRVNYPKNKIIRFQQGDILRDDAMNKETMLVCSTFINNLEHFGLVGAMYDAGIPVSQLKDERDTRYSIYDDNKVERCWITKVTDPELKFGYLACMELKQKTSTNNSETQEDNKSSDAEVDLLKNVFEYFRRMLINVNRDGNYIRRIVMTIPGIGQQGMEPMFVVPVMLANLRSLVRELEMLDEIVVYQRGLEKYEKISKIFAYDNLSAKKQVFISYSSKDADIANRLYVFLEKKKNIKCWKAPEDIPTGSDYQIEIPKGLQDTYILLVILSENSEKSRWCCKEIGTAVGSGHAILPYKVHDYVSTDKFNFLLDGEQIFPAYSCNTEEESFERIYKSIETYIRRHDMN